MEDLTLKQELFCQEWVDTVGNGTLAALRAFDISGKESLDLELEKFVGESEDSFKERQKFQEKEEKRVSNVAAVMANETLRIPKVIKRIDQLLEERGFTEEAVKQEHFKLVKQDHDLSTKARAISDYYKLKGKFVEHVDHTTKGEAITGINYIVPHGDHPETNLQAAPGQSSSGQSGD